MKQSFSYQPAQADKTDYLFSVLCVIAVLNLIPLPLTAIVAIFWIKKYQLPFMGQGFSKKINGKKLLQMLLLLLSGAAVGVFGWVSEMQLKFALENFLLGQSEVIPIVAVRSEGSLLLSLLVGFITALVVELAFRHCLYGEWSKYGIVSAIIGIGVISMLLAPIEQWLSVLVMSLGAAIVYEVTQCVVMTTIFHVGYLWIQSLIMASEQPLQSVLVGVVALVAAAVLLMLTLKLSPNWESTKTKIKVQQENKIKHPYVFRASYNFFVVVLVLFQTMPLWYPKFFG